MKLYGTMKVNDKGHLEIGGCDTVELAQDYGTPLYVLDEEHFRQNCKNFYHAFTQQYGAEVIYAGKSLLTLAVCRMIDEEGLSLDVVSGGELYTAIKANFPMNRVYFHGNNKTAEEIQMALEHKVARIIVDSIYELELLNKIAGELRAKVKILLRLTPGVEAHTHEYIKTGHIDSKFGLVVENGQAMEGVKRALELENIELRGFHCHIGSQIFELESYAHAAAVMMEFISEVQKETGFKASQLDLGGGLGIYYYHGDKPQSIKEYADIVMNTVKKQAEKFNLPMPKVMVEPGRSIAGPAGITLYRVGSVKDIPGVRKYVAVDGSMGDNPRPALYRAKYEAYTANRMNEKPAEIVSVAGRCCESGDMLNWDLPLPRVQPGDILAVAATGAYTYSMSSNYNRLPRPAMVLVNNGRVDLIIRRETYADLLRNDLLPDRLRKKVLNIASAR
ncbi:diaminopimelate decarboxylase [Desulfohalotomaculum tongense]|uniref:diaminopimelate decarboxylase n=1 Tax=Desulforadius tongensis TaxID=1216062 RepID=UPI00195AF735|nr:diaminopimelate decarboxylase [Desulforadius tongensis]MBM7854686.1 diaminopimelate decarboxylase [Desulforadius tongensis]